MANYDYEKLNLTLKQLEDLFKDGKFVEFQKGDMILEQNTEGNEIYYLKKGIVSVIQNQKQVAQLKAPCILGEMALFNQNVRTATVEAGEFCQTIKVASKEIWQRVLHHDTKAIDLLYRLGRLMSHRINEIERKIQSTDVDSDEQYKQILLLKKDLLTDLAIKYHAIGDPGKLMVISSKPVGTPEDLSIAYSPGVASPCIVIDKNPDEAFNLTTKGNLVGIITNATAVLGLGSIKPVASKPVMEGKALLFKTFANINAFDIEIDEHDPDKFIETVARLEPTFGGINLEDIKAPECFYIESELIKRLSIPVFHDDQHGTAIIIGAGLMNALTLVNKTIEQIRVVFCGAGAAGFSCANYLLNLGVQKKNLIMVDEFGVIRKGREMPDYLSSIACDTNKTQLSQVVEGADVFIGLSKGGLLAPEFIKTMNDNPIVFALANPTPEIDYHVAKKARDDVIIATGRSDYPNQINNVMAFPYIFRGALDTRARNIDITMKMAATKALMEIAQKKGLSKDYIVPPPHDPELLKTIPYAVAEAALVNHITDHDFDLSQYKQHLEELSERIHRQD